ncbi:MAG: tRNA (adenosine(37)-N6)-dimethylallyltransferase MiaA [Phycisphaerales bacterium]|nr:tRNA (adenosine(37)-N6)-dimethylallyltransferase MiaA [Phycisphaerales bacterium]MCB9837340.1 tRNA (adenosine(37)-N6)-dimethylallyltransferase MiaA [Phycisphaera sp.]
MKTERYPVICGPTAGGKTALALAIADELNRHGHGAEIVSADAYLVYRGLDIGTAKPTREELAKVPHHLVDIVEPTEGFTVAQWLALAERAIAEIKERGKVPIVVGGTHLFIKALIDGLFEGPEPDPELRAGLQALPADELRRRLEAVDPDAAGRIHPADTRRTIRALEVYEQTGQTITSLQTQWDREHPRDPGAQLVVLSWETATINSRINARVKLMRQSGLTEEVRGLHTAGRLGPTAGQALGYKQLVDHFEGRLSEDDAYERIKIETRRFAKNQRTWLRRLQTTPGTLTLRPEEQEPVEMAQAVAQKVLTEP